jgi:hypothetical protein
MVTRVIKLREAEEPAPEMAQEVLSQSKRPEVRLFDREVRDLYTAAMLGWRRRFRERLDLIVARYPPRIAVDLDHLADMLSAIAEGRIRRGRYSSGHTAPPRTRSP